MPEEETCLVDLEPRVKMVPVSDLDLDRQGLTLYTPPSSPEEGERQDEDGALELESPCMETDDQSDSTEEWGGKGEEASREGNSFSSFISPS